MKETKLPWTKCLPSPLLRIRTIPGQDMGVSPYEILFGLPYLGREKWLPASETNYASQRIGTQKTMVLRRQDQEREKQEDLDLQLILHRLEQSYRPQQKIQI